jgi:hypothetical protein
MWESSSPQGGGGRGISNKKVFYKSSAGTYTFRWEARIGSPYTGDPLDRYIFNNSITAVYHPVNHGPVNLQ